MENSFYYFFSATPQVLGGVLALFGVFVVFKIQTIEKQLIGIGQAIIDEVRRKDLLSRPVKLSDNLEKSIILNTLKKAINRNDINELKTAIELIECQDFGTSRRKYLDVYDFHNCLIKSTIYLSTFTGIIIVQCLAIIPFGEFLLCHKEFLFFMFGFTIVCISVCFIGLIIILQKSLKNSFYTLIPN